MTLSTLAPRRIPTRAVRQRRRSSTPAPSARSSSPPAPTGSSQTVPGAGSNTFPNRPATSQNLNPHPRQLQAPQSRPRPLYHSLARDIWESTSSSSRPCLLPHPLPSLTSKKAASSASAHGIRPGRAPYSVPSPTLLTRATPPCSHSRQATVRVWLTPPPANSNVPSRPLCKGSSRRIMMIRLCSPIEIRVHFMRIMYRGGLKKSIYILMIEMVKGRLKLKFIGWLYKCVLYSLL